MRYHSIKRTQIRPALLLSPSAGTAPYTLQPAYTKRTWSHFRTLHIGPPATGIRTLVPDPRRQSPLRTKRPAPAPPPPITKRTQFCSQPQQTTTTCPDYQTNPIPPAHQTQHPFLPPPPPRE